jgi:hypothetical protein
MLKYVFQHYNFDRYTYNKTLDNTQEHGLDLFSSSGAIVACFLEVEQILVKEGNDPNELFRVKEYLAHTFKPELSFSLSIKHQ